MKPNRDSIRHLAAVLATVAVNYVIGRFGHMPSWLPRDQFLTIVDMLVVVSLGHDVVRVRRVRRSQRAQAVERQPDHGAGKDKPEKVEQ